MYHILMLGRMRMYLITAYAMQIHNMERACRDDDITDALDENSDYYMLGRVAYRLKEAVEDWEGQLSAVEELMDIPVWTETNQLEVDTKFNPDPESWASTVLALVEDAEEIEAHVHDLAEACILRIWGHDMRTI